MEPSIKYKGGGSFVVKPPQFSEDGQTVFIVWKNEIICYNTKTAKRLRALTGLQNRIVGYQAHFVNNVEHITACSSTGEVIAWNLDMGLKVSKMKLSGINLEVDYFGLVTPLEDMREESLKFFLSWISHNEGNQRVTFGYYNVIDNIRQAIDLKLNKSGYHVAISRSRHPFIVVVQNTKLYFSRVNNRRVFEHSIDPSKYFTCVACHPSHESVITGDSLGRVILWYNLNRPKNTTRAVYHWHTLPVRSLAFSSSGTNFYSGAAENVLVRWYVDDPTYKEFLPRLPSTIEHILVSKGNEFVAAATADNAVRVLDSKLGTVSIIQHLVLGFSFPAGIIYDQRSRSMVLNGLTGHVQFYSPNDNTLLYNLDVVGQNKLTEERDRQIENTNVIKIAMDNRGLWLATVEERIDTSFCFELRLKFWRFDEVKQQFELNTLVELPHEKSITCMLFQPVYSDDRLRCVTVGDDKKFKIWELVNAETIHDKVLAWKCLRVGFYRDLPCGGLAFSLDGSLMAVGFGPIVTTWLPESCELKCSLVHLTNRKNISSIQFGTSNQCYLLVAATSEQLYVWNLLTLSVMWTVSLPVSLLISSSFTSHMAVFTSDNRLFIFNPNSPEFLYKTELTRENENVSAAVFLPNSARDENRNNWCRGSQLFFINGQQELYCLDDEVDNYIDEIDLLSESFSNSLFASTVPKNKWNSAQQKFNPVQHLTRLSDSNKELKMLLDAPVHTLLPARLNCDVILRSIVLEHNLSSKDTLEVR